MIYEYSCKKCGILEVEQKIIDEPLRFCPQCKKPVSRLISRTNFVLIGKGWSKDGYSGS